MRVCSIQIWRKISFKTENLNDLLNFNFYLLDSENKGIEFIDDKKKMSILNFRIEVLQ